MPEGTFLWVPSQKDGCTLSLCQDFEGDSSYVLSWVESLTENKGIIWIYT